MSAIVRQLSAGSTYGSRVATTPHVQHKTTLDQLIEMWAVLPFWAPPVGAGVVYIVMGFVFPHLPYVHFLSGLAPLAAIIILLTGLFGWITKFEHRGQVSAKKNSFGPLTKLSWPEFEQRLAQAYRRRGYEVDETAASAHGFVDFILRKNGETIYVQAKHWKSHAVDDRLLRDLYRSMAGEAHRWVVVAMHGFTDEAKAWAQGRDIQLMDGDDLVALLGTSTSVVGVVPAPTGPASTPLCPSCGAAMELRPSYQGNAAFWGCSTFPKCTATRANQ